MEAEAEANVFSGSGSKRPTIASAFEGIMILLYAAWPQIREMILRPTVYMCKINGYFYFFPFRTYHGIGPTLDQ